MLSPEVIAEQVMGYVVGATEMIPTLTPSVQPHTLAMLPQGSHFYTGLLWAAGYLLLDGSKNKLLIISQQQSDADSILIDTNDYGLVFGKRRQQSSEELGKIAKDLKAKNIDASQVNILEDISDQLPFMSIIADVQQMVHIGIGSAISSLAKKRLLDRIQKHSDEYNIVILTNIELPKQEKNSKKDEQERLTELITCDKQSNIILEVFQKISKMLKQETEIVAYIHPKELGKSASLTTRYVCAVG